jgi:hypothetical protein
MYPTFAYTLKSLFSVGGSLLFQFEIRTFLTIHRQQMLKLTKRGRKTRTGSLNRAISFMNI